MGSSSKKSNTIPTGSTVKTSQLPGYMQPYIADILSRGYEISNQPYVPYKDPRIAGFTPEETSVQRGIMALQLPGQYETAKDFATRAGNMGLNAYQPAPSINAPNFLNWGGGYGAGPEGGPSGYQMTGPGQVTTERTETPQMTAAQTGFAPNLQTFQMEGPEGVSAERATTGSFIDPNVASQYMSPYMQNVVDVQKQAAIEDAKKAQLGQNLSAARQGTYGGARQILAQGEREKALGQQLGQIQATGSQAAYDAAQRQFEAEQNRGLEAQKTNIMSKLEADRANQQAGLTTGQQNLAAKLGVQDLSTKTGLDTALANLSADQQTNVQNLAAKLEAEGMNKDAALRAALANQETELETGRTNLGARMNLNELYNRLGLDVSKSNLDAEMEARRLGLTGANIGLDASKTLSGLGSSELDDLLRIYGAKSAVGEDIRGMTQKDYDMRYEDFLRQKNYDMDQLERYASLFNSLPSETSEVTSSYSRPPSLAGQLLGAAGNLGSAYMMSPYARGEAKGGEIKKYNNGGLVALASGGATDSDGSTFKLRNDPKEILYSTMGDPGKLQEAMRNGADPTAAGIAAMLAKRIHDAQAMASAPKQTTIDGLLNPQPQMPPMPQGQPQGQPQAQPQGQPQMPPAGLASAPVPDNMFAAAEGGIIGYSHGGVTHFDGGNEVVSSFQGLIDQRRREEAERLKKAEERERRRIELLKRAELEKLISEKSGLYAKGKSPLEQLEGGFLPYASDSATKEGLSSLSTEELENLANYASGPSSNRVQNSLLLQQILPYRFNQQPPAVGEASKGAVGEASKGAVGEASKGAEGQDLLRQYLSVLGEEYKPQADQSANTADDFKSRFDQLTKQFSGNSKVKDEYMNALLAQKKPEDRSKEDFWRTVGEYSSELTRQASEPGANFLGSALGATSVVPGSVAKSIDRIREQEAEAERDKIGKLAVAYDVDLSNKAETVNLFKTAYDMTEKEAENKYNREKDSYERWKDQQENKQKSLAAQIKLLEGEKSSFDSFDRQVYADLISKGYSPEEALQIMSKNKGGDSGFGLPTPSDQTAAYTNASEWVTRNHPELIGTPQYQNLVDEKAEEFLRASGLEKFSLESIDEASRRYGK